MKYSILLMVVLLCRIQTASAQCTPSVTIVASANANLPAPGCQAVIDTFWAIPVNGGTSPTYSWAVGNDTAVLFQSDSMVIANVYPGSQMFNRNIYVSVDMVSNAACAQGQSDASASFAVAPIPQNVSLTQTVLPFNADSQLVTYYITTSNVDSISASQFAFPGGAFANIPVRPRGTTQHPVTDTLQVVTYGISTAIFNCFDTAAGCNFYYFGDTLVLYNDTATQQPVCLVSIDTATGKPVVVWNKVDKYAAQSYLVYRANGPYSLTPVFNQVAVINSDSLSEWEDTNAYPDSANYGYAIRVLDTAGRYSYLSPGHFTMLLTGPGNGSFVWTPYIIQNDSLPPGAYAFYRDAQGNGNWQLLSTLADTQTTFTDTAYASYPNARYMVVLTLNTPCNPSRGIVTVTSNIITHALPTGLNEITNTALLKCSPNPVSNNLDITFTANTIQQPVLTVTNVLGQTIYKAQILNPTFQISTKNWQGGIYFVCVSSTSGSAVVKILKL